MAATSRSRKTLITENSAALRSVWHHNDLVVIDSGALPLEDVFKLICEGENLPVIAEEELQSLRARSMLHCVCLKPYNSRSMVSCSQCGEWYHTYCVKLHWRTEAYVCSACCPAESSPHIDPLKSMELKTPLLSHRRPGQ
ncbi:unnamed protein product [Eruca vesicaria subsp. sativa]|uniref:Zinc finger PHD-type domain-containing protein n=1 Tax=Eruca vesicaria subsp. sativa TaxID=29727 RepID=A0ABC8M4I0_ERUVS|nr:unnamed protein product [Eruca vesicaria subsp. sativa]